VTVATAPLGEVKMRWDPENVFRINENFAPRRRSAGYYNILREEHGGVDTGTLVPVSLP
jgi:hypothetical protein